MRDDSAEDLGSVLVDKISQAISKKRLPPDQQLGWQKLWFGMSYSKAAINAILLSKEVLDERTDG